MNITLAIASRENQSTIAKLLSEYLHELGVEPTYPYLALYWKERERFPYLIQVDGTLAGFALVRALNEQFDFEMSEFYVLEKWRRQSVGREAALKLISAHPGKWRISVLGSNTAGREFWRSFVSRDPAISLVLANEMHKAP